MQLNRKNFIDRIRLEVHLYHELGRFMYFLILFVLFVICLATYDPVSAISAVHSNLSERYQVDKSLKSIADVNDVIDYLDKFITDDDMYYLEKRELARDLIEHCLHGKTEVLKRSEFEAKKKAAEEYRRNRNKEKKTLLAHKDATAE